uniref:Uncharacterized protein n=1 Tax=Rangifer tarandus platyrhynchus TaxID=3082113 RepID=A0ACB0E8K3_RANTA|nr:unnamed protein product [Rangifer tarandus platyrhynchus]
MARCGQGCPDRSSGSRRGGGPWGPSLGFSGQAKRGDTRLLRTPKFPAVVSIAVTGLGRVSCPNSQAGMTLHSSGTLWACRSGLSTSSHSSQDHIQEMVMGGVQEGEAGAGIQQQFEKEKLSEDLRQPPEKYLLGKMAPATCWFGTSEKEGNGFKM